MSANRSAKHTRMDSLKAEVEASSLVVVLHVTGLNAAQTLDLRRAMRAGGARFKIGKNTLARLAVKGTKAEGVATFLKGPTALAMSDDPVVAAKVAAEFSKKVGAEACALVGGVLNGQTLDAKGIAALATLPSLEALRGKLVGLLVAPATKIACVLQAPGGQVARVLAARARQEAA